MGFDVETLNLLRRCTWLGPIGKAMVQREKRLAIESKRIIDMKENCDIEADMSKANQLEAKLRYKIWKDSLYNMWKKNGDDMDYDDFAMWVLYQQVDEKKQGFGMR